MLCNGWGLEVVTDVGEESAVEGVVSSASTQLRLCLNVGFLSNTGWPVLAPDSNFWSDQQKTWFLCEKMDSCMSVASHPPTFCI